MKRPMTAAEARVIALVIEERKAFKALRMNATDANIKRWVDAENARDRAGNALLKGKKEETK